MRRSATVACVLACLVGATRTARAASRAENAVVVGANFRALATTTDFSGYGFSALLGYNTWSGYGYAQFEVPVNWTRIRYYDMTEIMVGGRLGLALIPRGFAIYVAPHLGGATDGNRGYFTIDAHLGAEVLITRWVSVGGAVGLQAASCGASLCAFAQGGATFRIPDRSSAPRGY